MEDSNQSALLHSQIGVLSFPPEEMMDPWLPIERPSKTLIRLFVCFVALRLKSTAMVMAGRSVHLTTLFPGQA